MTTRTSNLFAAFLSFSNSEINTIPKSHLEIAETAQCQALHKRLIYSIAMSMIHYVHVGNTTYVAIMQK